MTIIELLTDNGSQFTNRNTRRLKQPSGEHVFDLAWFASAQELETTLGLYLKTYNHPIPRRAPHHKSPVQALKKWQRKKPELLVNRVYEQSGLDNQTFPGVFVGTIFMWLSTWLSF